MSDVQVSKFETRSTSSATNPANHHRKKLTDCAGHFGFIHLELPVYHVGYFKHTVTILQCICKTCARVLLPVDERAVALRKMRNPRNGALARAALFKKTTERCKKTSLCPYCGAVNGVVKKVRIITSFSASLTMNQHSMMVDSKHCFKNCA